jgi:hypothetical protein
MPTKLKPVLGADGLGACDKSLAGGATWVTGSGLSEWMVRHGGNSSSGSAREGVSGAEVANSRSGREMSKPDVATE